MIQWEDAIELVERYKDGADKVLEPLVLNMPDRAGFERGFKCAIDIILAVLTYQAMTDEGKDDATRI